MIQRKEALLLQVRIRFIYEPCVFFRQISVFLEEFRGLMSSMVFLFDRLFFLKDYIDEKLKTLERVQFHATDGSSTNDVEILSKNKHTSNGLKYTLLQKIK